jgi:hypothetical protein
MVSNEYVSRLRLIEARNLRKSDQRHLRAAQPGSLEQRCFAKISMRFSIYLDPQTSGPEKDCDHFKLSVEQALRVTEAGFDGIALTEHHVSGYNTFSDNIMMAARLAPQVRRGIGE